MFKEGQKVICVNDRFPGAVYDWGDQLPVRGSVYTVRLLRWMQDWQHRFGWALLLAELSNPGDRLFFSAWRFRRHEEGIGASRNAASESAPEEAAVSALLPA